ncbi:hypothetical protein [Pontibacter beigongshangensis]|uniref:hypothetical protein n=1 Tax=Pontibacter beigongshangensis TaxID=2574733 RepID=UPI00165018BE|nr:hypothetical protein [Pontibacter beigongshangensis]
MNLVADSGSTKTDWRILYDAGVTKQVYTRGINPQYLNPDQIYPILEEGLLPELKGEQPQIIYYYGAGCSSADRNLRVEKALRKAFPESELHVDHDLLAAARAVCGNEPGIACILGTGSNSCLYDGNQVIDNVPSLGFLLGDEGSGACLGKILIKAYLYRELPAELAQALKQKYNLTKDSILDTVYNNSMPGTYLAAFTRFVLDNIEHPLMQEMVYQNFDGFFATQVSKYSGFTELPVNFVGSIAYHFSEGLHQVAEKYGARISTIIKSPGEGLVAFHRKMEQLA